GFVPLELDEALTSALKAFGLRHGATAFMTVLAGWALVLSKLSGQKDVVIGTPTANRTRSEVEGLIGFFVNTLALRLDLSGSPTVEELLGRVRAAALGAQEHQDLPFEQVVEQINPVRSLAHAPLFQVVFAWEETGDDDFELPGLSVGRVKAQRVAAQFDLTLVISEREGRLAGGIEYASALFDAATVGRFVHHLREALTSMIADPRRPVGEIDLLGEAERHRLLVEWNRTEAPYPADICIHELFEAQAARDPQAPALVHEGEMLSYGALNARANRLARHLRTLGVGPDRLVAICTERSPEMVVALLAVLKAGGAYLPLDPSYPAERLAFMLADAAPVAVLTDGSLGTPAVPVPVVDLGAEASWIGLPDTDLDRGGLTPRNLAYVIYTSGSTGTPKGVMVEHAGLAAVAAAWERSYALRPGLVHLQMAGFSFDVFTADIVRALGFGGTLVLCPRETLVDAAALYHLLQERRVSFADFVPAVLNELMAHVEDDDGDLSFMETVVCGSDVWTADGARRLRALCGPGVRIVNAYGVTEATVDSTGFEVGDLDGATAIPIGRPIANTRIYLLDDAGAPVPVGVAGEIHVGGAGVARGYLNRPELTAERFVASPFVAGDRLYRTGDLGRWRPDGTIEFLGRNDFQAKVRGFRIELGEIEARLSSCPGIRDAVVVARDGRLAAYYTTLPGAEPEVEALRAHLSSALPDYMVPAAYVRLRALPLTPNGKVDRAALPAAGDAGTRTHVAPVGPVETAVAAIWADVLKVGRVGRQDHFFELGGHSLLAVRLASKVRQALGSEVPASALFAAPTLEAFAARVASSGSVTLPPIAEVEGEGPFAPSFAQQRLWFVAQVEGGSEAYHMPIGLRLRGGLDEAALKRALDRLVARHEALRTTFVAVEGEPFQRVAPADIGFDLRRHDLTGRPGAE
ncbi:amino acid adenylation domain-containing protein, partial [Arenibaculum sp.]|uniref:non-ribosomal peptide synthetase n=1 Tax=Arenibaculum sp. TaxID=2865862 RepID=UPI002E131E3B|nr:amino acid adenylation domain-containing protein [Arenibaculum sp.]